MRVGAHVSVSGGPARTLRLARDRGCETIQLFASNPRAWALGGRAGYDDEALSRALQANHIHPVLLHTPYLVNIAARDTDVCARSVASLVHAAGRARCLGGYVVVHAGRDSLGPREPAVARAAAALLTALKLVPSARLLLEPTAGGRGAIAATVEQTAELLRVAGDDQRIGVCPDTCHAFATGYRLCDRAGARAWLDELDRRIGMGRIPAFHVNDSRDPCGSGRDRHWHVGLGEIGATGFRAIVSDRRLRSCALVIETPGRLTEDLENLARLRDYARSRPSRRSTG